jgi:hypothetical protein
VISIYQIGAWILNSDDMFMVTLIDVLKFIHFVQEKSIIGILEIPGVLSKLFMKLEDERFNEIILILLNILTSTGKDWIGLKL